MQLFWLLLLVASGGFFLGCAAERGNWFRP